MKRISGLTATMIAVCLWLACSAAAPSAAFAANDQLSNDDCIKCHTEAPMDVAAQGGAHKTAVTCMECHEGHPPTVREIIPACNACHSDTPHFQLENCLGCHTNPHAPLVLTLTKDMTAPCLTCHTEQNEKLQGFKSFHSTMACTACHNEHGQIPDCVSCHEPHATDMVQADCGLCHQAHKPLVVVYADDIASKQCGACHDEALNLLTASAAKHRDLPCAQCHKTNHKTIPACQDCHGTPHSAGILSKFPQCGQCHNTAHDLNR
ncbi:MAG: cytochrome C [Deltaproteobacteria bacterium]|nr:cytochrome C [Candidatus Anaeroferrophillus wilburensis]MBN2888533.1 cytochrome C [Deltaproteobacteria bacterium]